MTREELRTLLRAAGVPDGACHFGRSILSGDPPLLPSEAYVLEQQSPALWYVYYSERGFQNSQAWFGTEDEACRYLLAQLVR